MSTHLVDHYNQAWLLVTRAHRNQILSGSPLPYLAYLGMVAGELLAADRDGTIERFEETLQIVVLCDTLEDTVISPEELRQQLGEFVCAGVQVLNKRAGDGPRCFLGGYLQAPIEGPMQYVLVKLRDRITNPQPSPQTRSQNKIANCHQESQLILARLGHAHVATARRLREKIKRYHQYYWGTRRQSESIKRGAAVVASKEPVMSQNERRLSFEFFLAKTEADHEKLLVAVRNLVGYEPDLFFCIYGIGGSTRNRMLSTVLQLSGGVKVPVAPRLSCVGDSKAELCELFGRYRKTGIRRIVALRGDLLLGMDMANGELRYADELVDFIRTETDDHFHIKVAAYPKVYPQARSFEDDLANFMRRVEVGASNATTQYFLSASAYFYFVGRVAKFGVDIPVIPGIIPITNYSRLARFFDVYGVELPCWIRKQLEACGDDSRSIQAFGEQVISEVRERLLEGGAPGLYFYTLNQADPSLAIWKNLRLPR